MNSPLQVINAPSGTSVLFSSSSSSKFKHTSFKAAFTSAVNMLPPARKISVASGELYKQSQLLKPV